MPRRAICPALRPVRALASLSISIVLYFEPPARLARTLADLGTALDHAARRGLLQRAALYLVDNTPPGKGTMAEGETLRAALGTLACPLRCEVMDGHGNVGYGAGHNLAWERDDADFHLIMNPDVNVFTDALAAALEFMEAHPGVGLVAPAVTNALGHPDYLCKRPPAVLDLALRGFAPPLLKRVFRRRLHHYEVRDRIRSHENRIVLDPGVVSGSFMFFRRAILAAVQGFDPRYFLYFEDFDLSLRVARITKVAYVPSVRIVHHGGGAARKGLKHIGMFSRSALRYFRRHGWRWV